MGSVFDITPTILTLSGIPVGADMKGKVLENVLEQNFLRQYPVRTCKTHDTKEWLSARSKQFHDSRAPEERLEQLRLLGYIE